jgi:hypothetical protein
MNEERDAGLVRQIKAVLDQSAENLEPGVATRLRAMRREALNARRHNRGAWVGWSAALVATAASLFVAFNLWVTLPESGVVAELADTELATDDALELYEELEFYEWLDAHEEAPG